MLVQVESNSGNAVVISTVCVLSVLLVVATVLAHYWDVLESRRYGIVPLCGIDGMHRYELMVFTGRLPGSGQTLLFVLSQRDCKLGRQPE